MLVGGKGLGACLRSPKRPEPTECYTERRWSAELEDRFALKTTAVAFFNLRDTPSSASSSSLLLALGLSN